LTGRDARGFCQRWHYPPPSAMSMSLVCCILNFLRIVRGIGSNSISTEAKDIFGSLIEFYGVILDSKSCPRHYKSTPNLSARFKRGFFKLFFGEVHRLNCISVRTPSEINTVTPKNEDAVGSNVEHEHKLKTKPEASQYRYFKARVRAQNSFLSIILETVQGVEIELSVDTKSHTTYFDLHLFCFDNC